MNRTLSLIVALSALLLPGARGAVTPAPKAAGPFDTVIKPLLEERCLDCHDEQTHKAGLRLDNLKPDFRDPKASTTWEHVFDKMASGEMPPKKKAPIPPRQLETATGLLRAGLQSTSLGGQQKQGRVVVRRLNGTEYENTLHDLLAIKVPLKEMLPEDNTVAGFDNVSTGLALSATPLLRLRERGRRVIQSLITVGPPIPFSDQRTGKEM